MADDAAPPLPGSPGAPLWDPLAVPAATVIVLRDGPDGPEALMLKRDRDLSFAGGMWVFPGGRIDEHAFDSAHCRARDVVELVPGPAQRFVEPGWILNRQRGAPGACGRRSRGRSHG